MKSGASPAACGPRALGAHGAAVGAELVEDLAAPPRRTWPRTACLAELRDQRLVARQRLLDLDRVVGEELGGRVDAGQAAADHHRRQPHLQVRERVAS